MNKRYTYVTTYIVRAPDEASANEVREKVESQLSADSSVFEAWTRLTDIDDETEEEPSPS